METVHRRQTGASEQLAREVSGLLLPLYRLPASVAVGDFDRELVCLLRQHIAFDGAWFGHSTLTDAAPRLHSWHLHNLKPDFLPAWEEVKDSDPMPGLARARPDTSLVLALNACVLSGGIRTFCRDQGIDQVLFAAAPGSGSFRSTHLSLYRAARRPRFEAGEARILELIIAHVAAALEQNRLHWLNSFARRDGDLVALCDGNGVLLHAEVGFRAVMAAEWPGWQGESLPADLMEAWAGARGALNHQGRRVMLAGDRLATCLRVSARRLGRTAGLSPREREVVQLFGQGRTYKQVARQLALSPATVRHHLRRAYEKLEVDNKGALCRLVVDGGLD